jgi:hypothetical protein
MLVLVPHKTQPRGKHGYNPAASGRKQVVTNVASMHLSKQPASMEQTSSTLDLYEISSAMPGIIPSSQYQGSSSSPPKDANPDIIPPSAPSSYLATPSVGSSGTHITSTSRASGKRKADAPSEVSESSRKRSRAPTVAAQAQLDGSAAMQDIASAFKDFSRTMADSSKPSSTVRETDLSQAIDILNQHTELAFLDRIAISDYLANNLNQAIVFRSTPDMEMRKVWIQVKLQSMRGV